MSQDQEHDEPIMYSFSFRGIDPLSAMDQALSDLGIQARDPWEHGLPRLNIEGGDDSTITVGASWPDNPDADEAARRLLDMGIVVEDGGDA